jgi:hypothetical protein
VSTPECDASEIGGEIGETISISQFWEECAGFSFSGCSLALSADLRLLLRPNRMMIAFPDIAGDALQPNQNLDLLLERQPGKSFSAFGLSSENSTDDSSIQSGGP